MATDFEAYSHEQLLAMIASLDSATVVVRATQLQGAAVVIKGIGESLRKHQVTGWEGEAADSFQKWVTWAGNATLRLADYSEEGSKWMTQAAQTMAEVKTNTPKYDASAAADLAAAHRFHNDPDAQQLGRTANSKLNGDRQEAIQQLTKLAQSYDLAATQLSKAEAPTFRPPPPEFEPIARDGASDIARSGGGSGGGPGAGGSTYPPAASVGGASSDGLGRSPEGRMTPAGVSPSSAAPMPALPDRDVNVDLSHVATLPDRTPPPTTGAPGSGPSIPGGGTTNPVMAAPHLPLPSATGLKVPGSGPLPGTRPPSGLGGGKTVGLPPRDSGIVGGRQLAPSSPGAGIPRGTVIGAEGTPAVARGVGGAVGGGLGTPHGPSGGSPVGRRLAVEQGGIVGGRQAAAGSRPVSGGQSFTQGGSGLVRNAGAMGGHAGTGAHVPGRRRGEQGAARPNYLAEDEETWQADRRVVPPVID
ncbi:WXG100 family type VII secretion target [Streptomyces lavendulae]|uniref:WXG100 family type VII secretion target n=1 Tax=Streptomyces lavendulae TaxID=1914 RepID=UPI00368E8FC2